MVVTLLLFFPASQAALSVHHDVAASTVQQGPHSSYNICLELPTHCLLVCTSLFVATVPSSALLPSTYQFVYKANPSSGKTSKSESDFDIPSL